jgi:Co/Zn/Cd efflux system component
MPATTSLTFALLLAALGVYVQTRPGNQVKTFGYQRAGVLALR